jgi:hypothetical protein
MARSTQWTIAGALSAVVCGLLWGCPDAMPLVVGEGGSGGSSPSPTSSGTGGVPTSPTSSGTGGVPTSSSSGGTGGSTGAPCAMPTDCAAQKTLCKVNTCSSNVCGTMSAAPGTGCADSGGAVCDGNGACVPIKRVFVTSMPVTAMFGGALGGDTQCQSIASDRQLGGIWMSWLSDSTTSPSARFSHATVSYQLLDANKTIVTIGWAGLTSGTLSHAIDIDETGATLSGAEVWTATDTSGNYDQAGACGNWQMPISTLSAYVGLTNMTDDTWTSKYLQFCADDYQHLYCFEQ